MITVIPYDKLGNYDFGWLNAHYHFSFGHYYDPARMGFGALRVVNDDTVAPGKGFDPHPHRDMEIITYVRSGAITHEDDKGHAGRTLAGDVQVMSAGSGITHSEYNNEKEPATLYQIWIMPRESGVMPRWDSLAFPKAPANDALKLLVSGRDEDASAIKSGEALYIHADASVYGGRLEAGAQVTQAVKDLGYLLVSEGAIEIDGQKLGKGDAAQIVDVNTITIKAEKPAEVLLIDVAP
jgi:redox-sensitive bicupin YhaK (pirin superfamily)